MLPAGNIVLNITRYDNDGEPCVTDEVGRACLEGRQCIEGICIPSLCSNGEDDDLDELIDFPNDPGCAQPSDQSEEDPPVGLLRIDHSVVRSLDRLESQSTHRGHHLRHYCKVTVYKCPQCIGGLRGRHAQPRR